MANSWVLFLYGGDVSPVGSCPRTKLMINQQSLVKSDLALYDGCKLVILTYCSL